MSIVEIFNKKIFKITLLFLVFFELFSFFGWLLPQFNSITFLVILAAVLVLSLYKLEYGIYILLTELFVGSKGYLFSLKFGSALISIRIGLFLVVLGTFLANVILKKTWRGLEMDNKESQGGLLRKISVSIQRIFYFPALYRNFQAWLYVFAIVLIWGFVWGLIRGNGFGNVFLDFNNWLYFLLIFPFFYQMSESSASKAPLSQNKAEDSQERPQVLGNAFIKNILAVLAASVVWLGIKSLVLLYIFSHQFAWALPEVYKWVRDTGVGEVTFAGNGFYRVFFQSQIFSLLAFFIFLPFLTKIQDIKYKIQKNYKQISKYLFLVICLTTVILSFSRSYWVGLAAGLFLYYFIFIPICKIRLPARLSFNGQMFLKKTKFMDIFRSFVKVIIVGVISFIIIFMLVNLPPYGHGRADLVSVLGKRATASEAAGASRINQLKPLALAIAKHPLIGSGFGALVTYITYDPRVVPETAGGTGKFTTYAFEWGYLDMILKFGVAGLVVYLILIFSILKKLFKTQDTRYKAQKISSNQLPIANYQLRFGFGLALVALLIVNIFSPYLNHPLGIGFIIITALIAANENSHKFA